jgi:hypothetical protein
MIPSDHFVRFYNEVFKFLEKQPGDELERYWLEISRHQERHCLKLFKTRGLQGMAEYWEHIRIEENCDLDIQLFDDRLEMRMNRCPSLSKVLDNDAAPCDKYCDHCRGWIQPLIEKAGFHCVYDIIDRRIPRCRMTIYHNRDPDKT